MSRSVIEATEHWVESVVIDLNLCPFAKREWVRRRVRVVESHAQDQQQLLADLVAEMALLEQQAEIETSLIVHPHALARFDEYNDFLEVADVALEHLSLQGVFQIASFHPDYQFAGTDFSDVENFTNRSPYPMLHILRESSLEKAIEAYPDTDTIPTTNIRRLRELGIAHMRSLVEQCL